ATARAGRALAGCVIAGDAIGLVGELGAGKTALVSAFVEALGVPEPATSPTFTLVNEYRGGRLPVWHADLYRLERARDLDELGLDELFERGGVVLIEWADRFPILPRDHLIVRLAHAEAGRTLVIEPHGPRTTALAAAWQQALQGA
ncbi:MAG: tRNA (adenosine(37)-N6)-threonylcarbamoyltransferase complex ATPase subunit type 1 TsaE, partial [Deltaproteobacteria bacterium]|nr:tRNA (adenosine(37)-N6)-threonylcarbamoyltransferase complex ATPase subunit type 1 TsaE [Deltaproteobacteria bacterium]